MHYRACTALPSAWFYQHHGYFIELLASAFQARQWVCVLPPLSSEQSAFPDPFAVAGCPSTPRWSPSIPSSSTPQPQSAQSAPAILSSMTASQCQPSRQATPILCVPANPWRVGLRVGCCSTAGLSGFRGVGTVLRVRVAGRGRSIWFSPGVWRSFTTACPLHRSYHSTKWNTPCSRIRSPP